VVLHPLAGRPTRATPSQPRSEPCDDARSGGARTDALARAAALPDTVAVRVARLLPRPRPNRRTVGPPPAPSKQARR
jgi:hypothetical protein